MMFNVSITAKLIWHVRTLIAIQVGMQLSCTEHL